MRCTQKVLGPRGRRHVWLRDSPAGQWHGGGRGTADCARALRHTWPNTALPLYTRLPQTHTDVINVAYPGINARAAGPRPPHCPWCHGHSMRHCMQLVYNFPSHLEPLDRPPRTASARCWTPTPAPASQRWRSCSCPGSSSRCVQQRAPRQQAAHTTCYGGVIELQTASGAPRCFALALCRIGMKCIPPRTVTSNHQMPCLPGCLMSYKLPQPFTFPLLRSCPTRCSIPLAILTVTLYALTLLPCTPVPTAQVPETVIRPNTLQHLRTFANQSRIRRLLLGLMADQLVGAGANQVGTQLQLQDKCSI